MCDDCRAQVEYLEMQRDDALSYLKSLAAARALITCQSRCDKPRAALFSELERAELFLKSYGC